MLRALEKRLKNLGFEKLSRNGVAASEIEISCHCDYNTFRELADVLSKEHRCHDSASNSRVAASPSFNATQTCSSASNNMIIVFSCLADLTRFLKVRDDDDFAAILFRGIVLTSSTLLRIFGSLIIEEPKYTNFMYD